MRIRRKRLEPVKETQMVSLADIAFLIIFFFMHSRSFMRDHTQVALPVLPRNTETQSQITVSLDNQSRIFLDDEPIENAAALESQLRSRIGDKANPQECEVRFKCDKDQKYKVYHPVYEAIANAGGVISIIHELRK